MNFYYIMRNVLFDGLTKEQVQALLPCLGAVERSYAKDEVIVPAGQPLHSLGLILEGDVRIEHVSSWGDVEILTIMEEGKTFGEAAACARDTELMVDYVAERDCRVLFLDVERILRPCEKACPSHSTVVSNLIALLARRGVIVVHNPSSNMKLASGVAPVPAMLDAGVRLALGSDGAASNNRLNMFTEMGRAALLHKAAGDPETMPARTVLDMATRGGAAAMGGDGGVLAVGRPADCIALDLSAPNMQPLFNAASHAVYAATGMEVALTMVAGEVLYRDGRFSRFDYPALCAEVREMRRFVLRRLGLPEQVA